MHSPPRGLPPQSRCALSTRQRAPDPAPSGVSVSYSIRRAQAWRVRFGRGVGRSVIAHCSRVLQASAIESETSAERQRDASQARQLASGEIV